MGEVNIAFCETCTLRSSVIDGRVCPREAQENVDRFAKIFKRPNPVRDAVVDVLAGSVRRPDGENNQLIFHEETGQFESVPLDEVVDEMSLVFLPKIIECIQSVQNTGTRLP